jgi:hypothetical protein
MDALDLITRIKGEAPEKQSEKRSHLKLLHKISNLKENIWRTTCPASAARYTGHAPSSWSI